MSEETTYFISKITGEPNWKEIPVLPIGRILWLSDAGIRAQGQLCYDAETLYVHLSAMENNIRAVYTAPLSPVHEDSCLEFFFRDESHEDYFNFEINPNGCVCIQIGPRRGDRVDLVRRDAGEYFDIQTKQTEDGWEVFYRIPLKFIRLFYTDYRFEGVLRANLYKCGDKTAAPHYLSWAPIDLPAPDFHCPAYFGKMRFQ